MYSNQNVELLLNQMEELKYQMFEEIGNRYCYAEPVEDYIYDTFDRYCNLMYHFARKIVSIDSKYKKEIRAIQYDILDFFQNKFPTHIDMVREKMNV